MIAIVARISRRQAVGVEIAPTFPSSRGDCGGTLIQAALSTTRIEP